MKYRKKATVEAWKWNYNRLQEDPPSWVTDALGIGTLVFLPDHEAGPRIIVVTLEGDLALTPGNYLIRGVRGELYPCEASIFEETYELVEDENA